MIIAYVAVVSKVTDPWNLSGWAAPIHHLASLEILGECASSYEKVVCERLPLERFL